MRGSRADIEMQKSLAEAETVKTSALRFTRQSRGIVRTKCHIEGKLLVQRKRRAAHARIVNGAAMTRESRRTEKFAGVTSDLGT